jgi:hypothetical protein
MPRGRGGKRQGTPGKGYSNRTDLMNNYDPSQGSPAAGGVEAVPQGAMGPSPDDTPGLTTPSQYPDEPITEGLPIGPGGGPQRDTRLDETRQLRRYLPLLEVYINRPDTPDSVRALFRYIRGA